MALKDCGHSYTTVESMSRAKVKGGNTDLWPFARHERAEVVWLRNGQSRVNQEALQKDCLRNGTENGGGGCHAIHIGSG